MFAKLREKLHVFWMEHKYQIIGYGTLAVGIAGVYATAVHMEHKAEERAHAEMAAIEEAVKKQSEEESKTDELKAEDNPANQIASGGYFENWNDDLSNPDYPNILVNTVPISSMGEFGQNILDKLNEEYFGEFKDENGFKPETATADVLVDFGHEVWKMRNPKPEESQEEQAS